MINKKEIYKEFSSTADRLPIFLQPWWLDTVSENLEWDVSIAFNKENKVVGALPFFKEKKMFMNISRMPPLTPFLGSWLMPYSGNKKHRQYSHENRILEELIEGVPGFFYFSQKFSPDIENWYPFFLSGYEQTTSYTYILENIIAHDLVWAGMKNTVRTVIRNAEMILQVIISNNVDELFQLQESTFSRQNKSVPFKKDVLSRIYNESVSRDQGKIFIAKDKDGNNHAGLLLVWDHETAYNLVIGVEEKFKKSGAVQLLIWNAIKFASEHVTKFNFEGTMLPHVEPVFRHFGGTRTPYFRISKDRNRFIKTCRTILGR